MKYKPVTEESVNEMLDVLKPLGFVGNGKTIRKFTHTKLNRSFDFTAYSINGALRSVIVMAFNKGVDAGIESNQREIRSSLGLE